MAKFGYKNCAVCGLDKTEFIMEARNIHGTDIVSEEKFKIVKCRICGLIYVNPAPTEDETPRFYNIKYYNREGIKGFLEKWLDAYFNLRKKMLIKKYCRFSKLLDIGCGGGIFLSSLKNEDFDLYGTEPNTEGYDLCRQRLKANIYNKDLLQCGFADKDFSIITMWHVLEHVREPNSLLKEARRILKDDSFLIISVPNVRSLGFKIGRENWFHIDPPRHLYYYSAQTIAAILNKNGFAVKAILYPAFFEFPFDLYRSLLAAVRRKRLISLMLSLPIFILSIASKPICSIFKVSETFVIISIKRD